MTPHRYRKRPVEVFVGREGKATRTVLPGLGSSLIPCVKIHTRGDVWDVIVAGPGDYVIRGVKGEYYPCRGDIFEQTYEPVEEQP